MAKNAICSSEKCFLPIRKNPPFLVMPRSQNLASRMDQETGRTSAGTEIRKGSGIAANPSERPTVCPNDAELKNVLAAAMSSQELIVFSAGNTKKMHETVP